MLNKINKQIAICSILALALTACGNNKSDNSKSKQLDEPRYTVDENTPSWKLDTKENTELTWYVNADWWNTDWGNDVVTKVVKDDLNIDIKFLTGDDTKLNTFFAGGDMPDMITIFDINSPVAKKANTWAYPLNDLADKYDPYFYKVAAQDTINWYKLDDGKTYGYPDYSNTQADYDSGAIPAVTAFIIRKDVYEGLGSPSMSTQEEFISVMNQIKQNYPDLTPMGFNALGTGTGSLGADFQNLIGVPVVTDDNKFYDRNLDENYLSWIKTFNTIYKNGCINDDSFADDGTAFEEKVKAGKYACIMMGGLAQMQGSLQVFLSARPDSQYIAIDGPKGTREPTLSQSGISGWMINYITNQCKDPAKAIQIFTYLLSDDAQILVNYGIEGQTYEMNNGKYDLLPEVKAIRDNENERFKKEYRLGEFILFGHDKYKAMGNEAFLGSITQMMEWGEGKLKPQFIIENIDPDQGTAESRSLSAINTNWATTLVSMIRASDDASFDKVLSDYKQFLNDNNWDKILEIRNQKIEQNKNKLNLK